MNKPWLLMAYDGYYPSGGTGDWIDRFETKEAAQKEVTPKKKEHLLDNGVKIRDVSYDFYEIVNLETWTPEEN